jgi:hypothetical protein
MIVDAPDVNAGNAERFLHLDENGVRYKVEQRHQ